MSVQQESKLLHKRLHSVFQISVFLKGAIGCFEVIGGLLLIFIHHSTISHFILSLTEDELAEDPNDFIAIHLIQFAQNLSMNAKLFAALYLLTHGVIKVFLVVELLRKKLWSYSVSIGALVLFILFQVYELSYRYSIGFLLITLFDLLVIVLIWMEYKNVKKSIKQRSV